MRFSWLSACALLCLSLSACGGGGDSGAPSSAKPGDFTLSAIDLHFSAPQGGKAPASQSIQITITGSNVATLRALYVGSQTPPPWMTVNVTGSGSSYEVVVNIIETQLILATHTSDFTVRSADSSGNVLKDVSIRVVYDVGRAPPPGSNADVPVLNEHMPATDNVESHRIELSATAVGLSSSLAPTSRVGPYVNSIAPTDGSLTLNARWLVASPVEPLLFGHNGGSQITVYNVYTGAVVRAFNTEIAGAGAMVISGDGCYLFVYDRTNIRVTQLDATTGEPVRHYPDAYDDTSADERLAYITLNGYPVIVTPGGLLYDTDTGSAYRGAW
jgi:hypothetical protein